MKTRTPEMARFNDALREVVKVSKSELTALLHDKAAIVATRQHKGPRPKSSASARASRNKG